MANREHLAILKQGVEVWNEWRLENPSIKPNLSKIAFSFLTLRFHGLDLRETNLRRADLSGVNFNGANLCRVDLRGANLIGTNLVGANLREADLGEVNLREANLSRANLSGVNLSNSKLCGVNLSKTDLSGVDFSGVDLREVNIREVNLQKLMLSGADFSGTNLSGVDLSGTNLGGAHFIQTQALRSNFQGADLTDACLLDWHINSETNFADVQCDAIYLGWDYEKNEPTDRRPRDPNKIFAPGDFARLMEQSQETVDLIFSQGIDWSAFLTSFQNLQISGDHGELVIQGINKKSDGSFVISVDTPLGTDKAAVERDFQAQYDAELKRLEATYQRELNAKDREIQIYRKQNTNMMDIAKMLASRPINVEASAVAENKGDKSIKQQFQGPVYGAAGYVEGDQVISQNGDAINMKSTSHGQSKQVNIAKVSGGTVNITNNEATNPEIAATLAYIEALIAQRTNNPTTASTTEQMMAATQVIQELETQPDWKQKAIEAAKGGALEVLKSNPVGAFVAGAIESWTA